MEPLRWTVDLRVLERRERRRLVALLIAFAIFALPTLYVMHLALSIRLTTITSAPSFVPLWIQQFWLGTGFLIGFVMCLGGWLFFQLARWGELRRLRISLERSAHPPVLGAPVGAAYPPRQP